MASILWADLEHTWPLASWNPDFRVGPKDSIRWVWSRSHQQSEIELFHFLLHLQISSTWQLEQILSIEFIESKASFLSYGDMAITGFYNSSLLV